ncbi:MAG TPA: alpha/beta hydrolase [Xanthobacteraceae bacterium]|nr:alpha/beta hydrolase [Xanthobacteraceae bacterium]
MAGRETFETVAGCKTRVMRGGGKGEPLIFLHGASGASQWIPFMDKLAEQFDVFVPEHPGFGGSDTPDWLDNVGDLAYFYLDFMDQLGLSGVHLVGTSMGGWLASEIAVRNQTALASLTLVAPVGIRLKGVRKADIFLLSPEETVRHLFHDPKLVEMALSRTPSEEELDIAAKNRLIMAKLAWEPRLFNPHLHKWLHRITVPTQIVWGENDRIVPAAYGPEFQRLIPGSKLEIIPECGHVPHTEKADVLAAKIISHAKASA